MFPYYFEKPFCTTPKENNPSKATNAFCFKKKVVDY